jgi:L-aspartate oxidase
LPLVAARHVAQAALARQESRGGHFRRDFPLPHAPGRSSFSSPHSIGVRRHAAS